MEIEDAIRVLSKALMEDPGYRETWKANIAMAFQDEFHREYRHNGVHYISNRAADNFIALLCMDAKER